MLALALAALALAACGGDDSDERGIDRRDDRALDSEGDRRQVRRAAELVAERSPARCERMTAELVERTYQTRAKCKKDQQQEDDEQGAPAAVREVTLEDGGAHATVDFGDLLTRLELEKRDGVWLIHEFDFVDPPRTLPKLGPRATAEAYYKALRNRDGRRFCGLLSKRHARDVVGERSKGDPIIACAAAIEDYDWAQTSKGARGIHARAVQRTGEQVAVALSHGKRALLSRRGGRWVIDDIRR